MGGLHAGEAGEDEPETHAERFFSTMRAWGLAEVVLDMVVRSIMERHEKESPLPPYPATLERKLDYLASAVERLDTLAAGRDWAEEAHRLLMSNKQLRNDIVHGSPLRYDDDGSVHFAVLRRRKGALPIWELRSVRPKDWDNLLSRSARALGTLVLLSMIVSPPNEVEVDQGDVSYRERAKSYAHGIPGTKAFRDFVEGLLAGRP